MTTQPSAPLGLKLRYIPLLLLGLYFMAQLMHWADEATPDPLVCVGTQCIDQAHATPSP